MSPSQKELRADRVERGLIERILNGTYPSGSELPGERVLCKEFGVARPALREALQRMSRDGWLDIQQGKATRVVDLAQDGTLSILTGILKADSRFFGSFVPDALEMWALVAPFYTAWAIQNHAEKIAEMIEGFSEIEDRSEQTVMAMWKLHRYMIELGGNVVYLLTFNSFNEFYRKLSLYYYRSAERRAGAHQFWKALHTAATGGDVAGAAVLVREYIMTIDHDWKATFEETPEIG